MIYHTCDSGAERATPSACCSSNNNEVRHLSFLQQMTASQELQVRDSDFSISLTAIPCHTSYNRHELSGPMHITRGYASSVKLFWWCI